MPDILIRGLSQEAYDYYKELAEGRHMSLNAQVKQALETGARRKMTREEWMAEADRIRERIAERWEAEGRRPPSNAELIREDRDSR